MSERQCRVCLQTKPLDQFSAYDNGAGLRHRQRCKKCRYSKQRKGPIIRPVKTHKTCLGCKETKPVEDFYLCRHENGKRYRVSYCRGCTSNKTRAWFATTQGKTSICASHLKTFGLTTGEFDAMVAKQGGVCAICQKPESYGSCRKDGVRRLSIDHSHATGKVRALLCAACNKAIGLLCDDPKLLRAAADYLDKFTP